MSQTSNLRRTLLVVCLAASAALGAPKKSTKSTAPPTKVQGDDVIAHLEASILWYHHVVSAEQLTGVPMDLVVRDATLQRSVQALQLAFDFARAEAAFLSAEKATPADPGAAGRSLSQAVVNASQRVTAVQNQIDTLDARLAGKVAAKDRPVLQARRKELDAELILSKQVLTTIQGMLGVVGDTATASTNSAGLLGQIATLERSVPEARHTGKAQPESAQKTASPSAPVAHADAFHPEDAGLIPLTTELITLNRAKSEVDDLLDETDSLLRGIDRLKSPLVNTLRTSMQHSQTLVDNSDGQDTAQIEADQKEIEALTVRFKQLATATVPIGEQQLIVETTRTNLAAWRNSIARESSDTAKYLFFRTGFILLAILVILGVSSVWNRLTTRYVTDQRHRRQFLVLRRVAVTVAILIVIALGFVTDFGSIATYAGFLTAGIALGLQNVILSVVAYFFLIGKYGIKVGDRITISGVTGDVIDIGLVRMYMMELAGPEMQPTGRTVVYANSIVFQPSALFKQMPGANYLWHTAVIQLKSGTDYQKAKTSLTAAVEQAYSEYREEISRQHQAFAKAVDMDLKAPEPDCKIASLEDGLQFRARFPVDVKRAADIDERILTALRSTIASEPGLESVGEPKIV